MTTRFYLPVSAAAVSPAFSAEWDITSEAERGLLSLVTTGTAPASYTLIDTTTAANDQDILLRQCVSDPLPNDITIDGTIRGQLVGSEGLGTDDMHPQMLVYVTNGAGTSVRGVLYAGDQRTGVVNELTTSFRNQKYPATSATNATNGVTTLTPVTAYSGDRIVVEIGVRAATAGGHGAPSFHFGDNSGSDLAVATAGSTYTGNPNPWVEFSLDLLNTAVVVDQPPAVMDLTAIANTDSPMLLDLPAAVLDLTGPAPQSTVSVTAPAAVLAFSAPLLDVTTSGIQLIAPADGAFLPVSVPVFNLIVHSVQAEIPVRITLVDDSAVLADVVLDQTAESADYGLPMIVTGVDPLPVGSYHWSAQIDEGSGWTTPTPVSHFTIVVSADGTADGSVTVAGSGTVTPVLWSLSPPVGTVGDTATAIGVGLLGPTSTAVVHLGAITIGATSAVTVPASANAYTVDRSIQDGITDPEHDEVTFVIPDVPEPGGALTVEGT